MTKKQELKIVNLYTNTNTRYKDILKICKIGEKTLIKILKKYNVKRKAKKRLSKNQINKILFLYKEGLSSGILAKKYNVADTQIFYHLEKHGIKRRSTSEAKYKGARTKTNRGYIVITPMGEDKKYLTSKRHQMMEHQLVMSKYLNRKLFKHEQVHHINGIRDDNRLENLELWSTSQPYGQRVSDKIKWAKQILEEYKDYENR